MSERNVKNANFVFFGGTSGMGRAAAMELAKRGANLLVVGRDPTAGAETVQALQSAGAGSARFLRADVSTLGGMATAAKYVIAWQPRLHGVSHSAMSAFKGKQTTADGIEFSFALQYLARAVLNRLLAPALQASGDGRIVHVSGWVGEKTTPDLDDLHYERTPWSFFKAVPATQALGLLHVQEAAKRWSTNHVTIGAVCAGPTRTKVMQDKRMPLIMRLMGRFGAAPEVSARNIVAYLTRASVNDADGAALRDPRQWSPQQLTWNTRNAAKLWDATTRIAREHGVELP